MLTTAEENIVGPPGLTDRHAVNDTTITVGLAPATVRLKVFVLVLFNAAAALRTFLAAKLAPLSIVFNLGQRPIVVLIRVLCKFLTMVTLRLVPLVVLNLKL